MTSTEQGRRKYDALADRYEEIFFYVADVGRRLVEVAAPAPGARVLDVGAGRGAVARAALDRGCEVTAVDASAGMVARLRADHPSITARQLDAGRLDFPDGSFDVVTAGFLVQVLDDPAAALAEFRRVLTPGGTVALSLERQTVGRLGWLHELNAEYFGAGQSDGAPGDSEQGGGRTSSVATSRVATSRVAPARVTTSSVATSRVAASRVVPSRCRPTGSTGCSPRPASRGSPAPRSTSRSRSRARTRCGTGSRCRACRRHWRRSRPNAPTRSAPRSSRARKPCTPTAGSSWTSAPPCTARWAHPGHEPADRRRPAESWRIPTFGQRVN